MRPASTREDRLLEQAARYHFWAKTYGYTKQQVDELPAWLEQRMPVIAQIEAEVQQEEQERAARRADE